MELWHALNRGVEKRIIFGDDKDRFRFVHALALFNTTRPATNTTYLLSGDTSDIGCRYEDRLVDVHAWCLMSNHYHLLLSERRENGISLFLRKLNVGYARYFNERHKRSGFLFQGSTKKKRIDSDGYFLHILHYIHLNPLDFLRGAEHWRERRIDNPKKALDHLASYRWSSYQDYCGRANFPFVLRTDLFEESLGNVQRATIRYLKEIEVPTEYALE